MIMIGLEILVIGCLSYLYGVQCHLLVF